MLMVRRPNDMNSFEFAVLAGLRAAQLYRGCTPRVERSAKVTVTAQHEIATRKVQRLNVVIAPPHANDDDSSPSDLAPPSRE
jgi:DNA-directed RNA polymerase subunit K/omega